MATLEAFLKVAPGPVTTLITFVQFVFISVENIPVKAWRLQAPKVPISRWLVHVAIFFTTSYLNNYAMTFADITIPIHAIFRSSGTIFTILIGRLFMGQRYNLYQVLAAMILTLGLCVTILGTTPDAAFDFSSLLKSKGALVLLFASILISINGFLIQKTFAKYPTAEFQEALFYQHFFSLPVFLVLFPSELKLQYATMTKMLWKVLALLALNVLTQSQCAQGVNRLLKEAKPETVSVTLLVRKFASLLISVTFFKNTLNRWCWLGTILVFSGSGLYNYGLNQEKKGKQRAEKAEKAEKKEKKKENKTEKEE